MSDNLNPSPPTDGSGFDKLGQKGRVEFRITTEGQPITEETRLRVIEDLEAYRNDNPSGSGPLAWGKLADMIGISASCLSDIRTGKYRGNNDEVLLKIDQFLADDRARAGRFDFRTTAKLSFTDAIFGVVRSGIRMNTMPVIVASSGVGKSQHARAFAADRNGVIIIRADEGNCDARGITKLLCNAIDGLRPQINKPHNVRLLAIKDWLRRHGTAVIIVDEAQKLVRSGLEMLRDIHDISDPNTRRNVPIVFFGDQDFLKLIFSGRAGNRSPLSPQCIRRMRPVLNIDTAPDCQQPGGGIYTVEDIVNIVRNNRVKLLTPHPSRGRSSINTFATDHTPMGSGTAAAIDGGCGSRTRSTRSATARRESRSCGRSVEWVMLHITQSRRSA